MPGLFYRFYKTGSFNLGASNYYDNNKAINKLSWASWDEISKISQRIVVELAAFWSGGELANLAIRGVAEIALVANTARRIGLVTEAGELTRWGRLAKNAAMGSAGSLMAGGARDLMHEGQFHWSEAGWGALYGVAFPAIQRGVNSVLNGA